MNLLAIDSFSQVLSAALLKDDEVFYEEADAGIKHCELVISLIENLLNRASLAPVDLNGVLCMGGPGSFTGLRIGYSIAKALSLSFSIPAASVPTLDCIVFCKEPKFDEEELILALIQARKHTYFYAFFKGCTRITLDKEGDAAQIITEIKNYQKSGFKKITLTGHGAINLKEFIIDLEEIAIFNNEDKGYSKNLLSIAKFLKIPNNYNSEFLYSGPEYIRKTDAEINLKNDGK